MEYNSPPNLVWLEFGHRRDFLSRRSYLEPYSIQIKRQSTFLTHRFSLANPYLPWSKHFIVTSTGIMPPVFHNSYYWIDDHTQPSASWSQASCPERPPCWLCNAASWISSVARGFSSRSLGRWWLLWLQGVAKSVESSGSLEYGPRSREEGAFSRGYEIL